MDRNPTRVMPPEVEERTHPFVIPKPNAAEESAPPRRILYPPYSRPKEDFLLRRRMGAAILIPCVSIRRRRLRRECDEFLRAMDAYQHSCLLHGPDFCGGMSSGKARNLG